MKKWIWVLVFSMVSLGFSESVHKEESTNPFEKQVVLEEKAPSKHQVNIKEVFIASPIIYSLLLFLSVSSFAIWLQAFFSFRTKEIMPSTFLKELRYVLSNKEFDSALSLCRTKKHLFANLMLPVIELRGHGLQVMRDSLQAEGKRASHTFWQKLSLLNDIAVIAPMLGLLGTVLGMFYAFYDINRSIESITSLFDGLGIAVGTTVVGLIVALFAMLLSTTLKHKMVKTLTFVEKEALQVTHLLQEPEVQEEKIKKTSKKRKAE